MLRTESRSARGQKDLADYSGSITRAIASLLLMPGLPQRVMIAICVSGLVGMVGCAGPHKSHLPEDLPGDAAHRITHALVDALSRTEVRAAGDPICIEAAASAPVFEQALRANLRAAGYAVMQKASVSGREPSTECLAFLGEERLIERSRTRIGLYCLCVKGGSICREYRLPDAQPVSSLSVAGLTYQVPPPNPGQRLLSTTASADGLVADASTASHDLKTDALAATTPMSLRVSFPYRGESLTSAHRAQLLRLVRNPRLRLPARIRVTGVSTRPDGYGDVVLARRRAMMVAEVIRRTGPEGLIVEVHARDRLLAEAPGLTRGVLIQVMAAASRNAEKSAGRVPGEQG